MRIPKRSDIKQYSPAQIARCIRYCKDEELSRQQTANRIQKKKLRLAIKTTNAKKDLDKFQKKYKLNATQLERMINVI